MSTRRLSGGPSSRLRAPEDGIVASGRASGPLSRAWSEIWAGAGAAIKGRVARGRSYARSGRIRDLWFAPGLANAQVVASEEFHVSLRVAVFDDARWSAIVSLLQQDLRLVADLLEGNLPETLVELLSSHGHNLIPSAEEIDGQCTCQDYVSPCEHVAGVFHLLSDAVEGDPFLLLTLRGRPRSQVLNELRAAWGDTDHYDLGIAGQEEEPPSGNWFISPTPLPAMSFTPSQAPMVAAGLRALGPPPGEADLAHALGPLYEAGGEHALELAMAEPPARRRTRVGQVRKHVPVVEGGDAAAGEELAQRVINLLANRECSRSRDIARELDEPPEAIRAELLELEAQGLVYRTGQTRGTRWWLQ